MAYINYTLLDKKALGQRLQKLRTSHKYTKQKIAKSVGIHVTNYTNNELGKSVMSLTNRDKIAQFYNIPIDYLLYNEFDLENFNDNIFNRDFIKKLSSENQSIALEIESVIKKHL